MRGGKEWARKGEEVKWDLHLDLTLQIPLVGREVLGGLMIPIGK